MVLKFARAAQDDEIAGNFHSIHTAVYIGDGKIAQVRKNGMTNDTLDSQKIISLSTLFNRYSAVSVSRMDLDKNSRNAFANAAKSFVQNATSYNSERAFETGKNEISNSFTALPTDTSSLICTDPLRLAAQKLQNNPGTSPAEKLEFQKLINSNMAKDIFENFYSPYSFNVSVTHPTE